MKILCGYNVNIDSVYRLSGTELSELLESFESSEILKKIASPPGRIDSVSDFAAGLAYCMKNGCGAEWLVFNPVVFEFLKARYFEKSLVRMGGNAGIMANALSELGASLVVPNVAVPSKAQTALFSQKSVYVPGNLSSKASRESGIEKKVDSASPGQDPIHFVFDFAEGELFSLCGEQVRVPRENRFIATCDQLNFRLFINPDFDAYALQHAGEMDGALISGFHLLLEEYPDGNSYLEILENAFSRLLAWKSENEKLRVHLEFGHFASRKIASTVFLKFAGIVDSLGMNEDELAVFHELHGVPAEGILRMDVEAVGKAASCLAGLHGLRKLLVHTREFVLTAVKWDEYEFPLNEPSSTESSSTEPSSTEPSSNAPFSTEPSSNAPLSTEPSSNAPHSRSFPNGVEPGRKPFFSREIENELKALDFGVKCAGTYATSGRLDGRDFVEKGALKLRESEFGREQVNRFLEAFGGEVFRNGAFAFRGGYLLCVVPTLLSGSPVTTVGLGDTLTAATFLRRLELNVQA